MYIKLMSIMFGLAAAAPDTLTPTLLQPLNVCTITLYLPTGPLRTNKVYSEKYRQQTHIVLHVNIGRISQKELDNSGVASSTGNYQWPTSCL